MQFTKEELAAKLEAHALWLITRFTGNVKGERADLTDADLTDADLTRANLNIGCASPFVYDALVASFAAQMALRKTYIEWMNH